jgi:hypothetical protein
LEDLDALAGNIAFNHIVLEGNDLLPLIVTAGVDRIRVRQRPNIDTDQYLSGKVTWVGSSSMEIRMRIADGGSEWLAFLHEFCFFLFALDGRRWDDARIGVDEGIVDQPSLDEDLKVVNVIRQECVA